MTNTATGLRENVAGVLCYVLGWITGIVFLLLEPENRFVRFHAFQSIAVFGALSVVGLVLSILQLIPFIGILFWVLGLLVGVLAFVLWIVLMVTASQGRKYKIILAGDYAERWAG